MAPIVPCHVGHTDPSSRWDVKERHFATVYKRYYRKVYLICRRYSAKLDDAEDLAHDVFMRYFLNFENFRHESSPSTWMYRVAVNLGIQRWRKERMRYLDDNELDSLPACAHDNESMLLDRITLMKIFDQCPERTRKVLSMLHIEGRTQLEVGKLLGISRATVIRDLIPLKRFRHQPKLAAFPPRQIQGRAAIGENRQG